ncbi:hypothetical protein TVAG_266350 [Trichomonas vaginalis G3]|uniref:VPS9 domain-containing protein n=1 Tax=Trichomonas vaginalis (strain ATCC PRA-98 / G3) TaxID=412133 RepID=A2DQI8_TRIV3|nr:VPS9 domain family [Trichomonas vaginalis G3]EAY17272.1 hypothetical protein TVAG_266350 [Trichomonas vaginalis G3]KAI5523264.1 VPS9 domain family [Trichomonas vaginalis G3]|eukprot:XP_001329495.1 hypothetical protein [Trichomonas vaginalis G3]
MLRRNIKATLHHLITEYCISMNSYNQDAAPLKMAISCHICTINLPQFQIKLHELFGQQSALTTLAGKDYTKYTRDEDVPADIHLKMITLIFPYEFLSELLKSIDFLQIFTKIILNYKPQKHVNAIKSVFNAIKKFGANNDISNINQFFTANEIMFFALAEHLVTIFTHKQMINSNWDPLRNFSTVEKSRLIAEEEFKALNLNQKLLDHLQSHHDIIEKLKNPLPSKSLNELREICETKPELEFDENEKIEIPALHHVVLELRKMPLQCSPSGLLFTLSNALTMLTNAVSIGGEMVGADEIFQFFVYSLSAAKVWCLPAMALFVEKFVDDALLETKFQYLITQLNCAVEFIEGRKLSIKPFIILPHTKMTPEIEAKLSPVDDEIIVMKRFAVYAYPTFTEECQTVFPGMIKYTGKLEDQAFVRKFSLKGSPSFLDDFESVASLNGAIFPLNQDYIVKHKMIRVDSGNMVDSADDINRFSTLMLMFSGEINNPSTGKINKAFSIVNGIWKMASNVAKLDLIVADLQMALVFIGKLPPNFHVDGIFNHDTYRALVELVGKRGKVELSPKMFENVKKLAEENK